ncbi:unnamed protein product [Withania somnifera]
MDGSKRVFQRLGPVSQGDNNNSSSNNKQQKVCFHWKSGRCNRFPCPFLHRELPGPTQQHVAVNGISSKRPHEFSDDNSRGAGMRRNPNFNNTWGRTATGGGAFVRKTEKVCNHWVKENCTYGDTCRYLHSWTTGDCFTLLTQLEGHQKVVTGMALPSGSDKLYSGSTDKTVRVWDCQSGQSAGVVNFDGEVGSMLSEGPWIFVGLTNLVKAWNTQTGTDLGLNGPVGQVYALVVGNDMLLAGTEDGILAWKYNGSASNFDPVKALTGHTPIMWYHWLLELIDYILVWNLETLQCLQVLTDHTSVVMSVLCWDQFLLSCSLDKTIKGLLALCGMHDSEAKPVLLCSCNDNMIRVYDFFSERGKIFSKEGVRRIEIGPAGLFFTGDESGQVRVWKWL